LTWAIKQSKGSANSHNIVDFPNQAVEFSTTNNCDQKTRYIVAKPELGTKRTCPETDKNFYDLNKDPIVSPYTDKEYPLSFFITEVEQRKSKVVAAKPPEKPKEVVETDDEDANEDDDGPEIISLEDADESSTDDDDTDDDADGDETEAIADLPGVDTEDDDDDDDDDIKSDDDTFLENEDEDTDLSDVIGTRDSNEKDEV
jgi:uncharacterized protein (TIGR02300 family)